MCNSQNCNCKKGMGTPWLCTIVVLMLVGLGIYGYNTYKDHVESQVIVEQEQVIEVMEAMSPEQRIAQWKEDVQSDYVMDTYLTLPEPILREILKHVGANASPDVIVENYDRNTRYYLSKYVQQAFKPELSGRDAKNIDRIEINTVMKAPEKETISIPTAVTDSIK